MKLFCTHKWILLHSEATESRFEVASKYIADESKVTIPWQMYDSTKKYIQILSCEKCGKTKKFVESN